MSGIQGQSQLAFRCSDHSRESIWVVRAVEGSVCVSGRQLGMHNIRKLGSAAELRSQPGSRKVLSSALNHSQEAKW